jgi:hypothetical protein
LASGKRDAEEILPVQNSGTGYRDLAGLHPDDRNALAEQLLTQQADLTSQHVEALAGV